MENIENILDTVTKFLIPLLPLANAHTVDFIVDDLWTKKIPLDIRKEAEYVGIPAAIDKLWLLLLENDTTANFSQSKLFSFVKEAGDYVVQKLNDIHYIDDLVNYLRGSCASDLKEPINVTEYMCVKKVHEVHIMSDAVACLAEALKSTIILDIGSGKGYLPSILALNHNLRILGIDDKPTNIDGAIRTTKKLEKKWNVYERKALSNHEKTKNMNIASRNHLFNTEDEISFNSKVKKLVKPTVLGDSYKQRIEYISCQTDIRKILSEEYPDETDHNILFVGLHTCGNLSPNSLKLFVNCEQKMKSIINIGCCYHLIDEEFCNNPDWHVRRTMHRQMNNSVDFGFPLSEYLRKQKFSLGRDARMCGTQNPMKIFKEQELIKATKPLFYRALLQELLTLKCGASNLPNAIVGRLAHKCDSFAQYATKALKKLNVSFTITQDELENFESDYEDHWQKLKIFFLLKTAISSVIETVILLDKLLYLHEKGIKNAFIARLFDPIVSPRCYAIVAINESEKLRYSTVKSEYLDQEFY